MLELPRSPRLVCVEYPGLVRDVGAMLRTLGGEQGVSRVRGPAGCGGSLGRVRHRAWPWARGWGREGAGAGARCELFHHPLCESFQPSISPSRACVGFGGDAASLLSPNRDSGGVR